MLRQIRSHLAQFGAILLDVTEAGQFGQMPLVVHPVWKTLGKKGMLADDCYDVFVWSNLALMQFIIDQADGQTGRFTRQERALTLLWDFAQQGKMNARQVIDHLTYNTKNDKALAVNGKITHQYMRSPELTRPRLSKWVTRHIVRGGGQHLLSPERRLDAIILNSQDLFNAESAL